MKKQKGKLTDIVFLSITAFTAFSIIAISFGIFVVLFKESLPAMNKFGFEGFIFSTEWDPVQETFGAAPALIGTLITSFFALLLAVPIATGIAIFITEIAPSFLKGIIGTAIELLAAIPSIIYGMWGLFTLAPIMSRYIEPFLQSTVGKLPLLGKLFEGTPLGVDLFTASIILSIMIIPFTASIARDSFNLTPSVLKESAYAIGATKWEVVKNIVLPYSKLGVLGGVGLSLGRSLGETMAVAFVLGNLNQIPTSLFDAAATVTVKLANEFTEADKDIYLSSLYYLAFLLFIMSFTILALAKVFLLKAERK
ncbi:MULTISPECIES: phosphate ABC transporter permease subunit PstC [Thermodesulfovibrio]|uniref:Phosphate transport system permease protein n=1 Tax=Thermodesulfovibrio yellowstonii (strain ATCC 51303 / DSM 11347 / YP87) TaxID=289376 RepID=B5YHJ5_THEYD|nr:MULTISPECIES: phosphate ABC transporter permease subunit PstC [Thermodesulfovibrio]ACI20441.1 phosphate ABC transporter, permease protein PstC [Thermodesulfovibrio yellowstonii DSM 11347]MDI6865597.1 phosphate ABC transporter permease subunit PstC [Thermodesulfovibrio yellowstonii]